MADLTYGWTKPLRSASLRADPSGVQDTGTRWQADLLPGMTTQTANVRYISLLTAGRYLRQVAGQDKSKGTSLSDYWRRLEALIAICSVLHHQGSEKPPSNIIGREYANRVSSMARIPLNTGLRNPPYRIYRGTLRALGLFDRAPSDPLYECGQPLGRAWHPSRAGKVGKLMSTGNLPEVLGRTELSRISGAFCLCGVPSASTEQSELIDLLFGLRQREECPQFSEEGILGTGARVVSWRLVLELVDKSPARPLRGEHLMGRILEDDILNLPLTGPLRQTLLVWRWIAARSFFERGWTLLFNQVFNTLRGERFGLSSQHLQNVMKSRYSSLCTDEPLHQLVAHAKSNLTAASWYVQRFQLGEPRDCLQMMVAGLLAAEQDRGTADSQILGTLYRSGDIPFASEMQRLSTGLEKGISASEFWAQTSIETLIHHINIGLRKMRQGNPDTLHVDFDNDRWVVPHKALGWHPLPSLANSRLDIALGWASQLGLVESKEDGSISLTALGRRTCRRWDECYKKWA